MNINKPIIYRLLCKIYRRRKKISQKYEKKIFWFQDKKLIIHQNEIKTLENNWIYNVVSEKHLKCFEVDIFKKLCREMSQRIGNIF